MPTLPSPDILTTIIAFVLVLGPLVVVHELGHYCVGRWFGVKADVFSVGFGKELAGFTDRRGTRWKLSALPLGGYVQFAGDMNPASVGVLDESLSEEERARTFNAQPLGARALIVLAGPVTNLLAAIAIFASLNMVYGKLVAPPEIGVVEPGSAAAAAGLRGGDRVLAIDAHRIASFTEIAQFVAPFPGETVRVRLDRAGDVMTLPVRIGAVTDIDRFGNAARIGRLGIGGPANIEMVPVGPIEATRLGITQTFGVMRMMATGIAQIFTGARSVKELGGPIKIAQYSGEQFTLGWSAFVGFAALISINLAFINLLPIPALDGGHLAFYAAEAVRRKPLAQRSQEWAFRTGFALVLALMLFVTFNDLASLSIFGG